MAPAFSKLSRRPGPVAALLCLLIIRTRILSLPRALFTSPKSKQKLSPAELNSILQQLYISGEDGVKQLLVPYQDRISQHAIRPVPPQKLEKDAKRFPLANTKLSKQLLAIARTIVFPTWRSKEAVILATHSFFLVLRTVLSLMVAKLDGRIVRDLVSANGRGFLRGLGLWFVLAIPSTITNSMIRTLQTTLSLSLQTKLTRYIHDLYLSPSPSLRYYRNNLQGVDQYITADVEAWSESVAGLYGNLLKPSLDLVIFTSQLAKSLGFRGSALLFLNYWVTVRILRAVSPGFGKLAAVEAKLEGEYRAGMGRVGKESEEVAFYDGGARERDILTRAYLRLIKHVNSIYKIRIAYEWTEDYVIKYLWSAAGYGLIAVPLLFTRTRKAVGVPSATSVPDAEPLLDTLEAGAGLETGESKIDGVAGRTETYISNRRLLLSLADAGGRLMYAYKDILELAGLTNRLYVLLSGLHSIPSAGTAQSSAIGDHFELSHVDICIPSDASSSADLAEIAGDEEESLTPAGGGHILVKDLSLVVKEGEHLMITGSNGVGKTAIARVLAGLWDAQPTSTPSPSLSSLDSSSAGPETPLIIRPSSLIIVPQRAYMTAGSLLSQIIYPHSYPQFLERYAGDEGKGIVELQAILEHVSLGYLPGREGGWDVRKEWRDVFSGGEKQRMSLARVFYHKPRFAILDECTSAVSSDVEGRMYEYAKSIGITLITISLRPSLSKYHNKLLTLSGDGSGSWSLSETGTEEERLGLDKEIAKLEEQLGGVKEWEARVEELDRMLKVNTAD